NAEARAARDVAGGRTTHVSGAEPSVDRSSGDVDALVARVKELGFVTTGEIFAALPDLEPETAELAAIYAGINARGIEVVDEIAEELQREDQRRAGRGGAVERSHTESPRPGVVDEAPARPGAVADHDVARHARLPRPDRADGS